MNLLATCKGVCIPLALCVAVLLAFVVSCSTLPRIVPDMARAPSVPVQLDGIHGPLSAERSKAILDRLKSPRPQHVSPPLPAGACAIPVRANQWECCPGLAEFAKASDAEKL